MVIVIQRSDCKLCDPIHLLFLPLLAAELLKASIRIIQFNDRSALSLMCQCIGKKNGNGCASNPYVGRHNPDLTCLSLCRFTFCRFLLFSFKKSPYCFILRLLFPCRVRFFPCILFLWLTGGLIKVCVLFFRHLTDQGKARLPF